MINRIRQMAKRTDGSVTLESIIALPAFLAFVIALNCMIQVAVTELALQSAVSETTKQIAAHLYPVRLLYGEAKQKLAGSKAGMWLQEVIDRVQTVRYKVTDAEDLAKAYERYIPEPILQWVEWEKQRREELEAAGRSSVENVVKNTVDPLLCKAFQPIVVHFADTRVLQSERLRVETVAVPSLEPGGESFVGIEAAYDLKLPIPFWSKTVTIRKKAYERAWIGE